ncbi:hypothetical protein HFN76_35915 [Rhizobium laguerreae]|uniref:hypothetical protein n=1 Tax=Rhizobium laguerreae TaxID=1076926 RepID=UPI001C90FA96|nr:hypothetical protein [Rhizobium laguerreae]MBY3517424.1 hypothetical protein [Rhizobium laguerreae]
MKADFDWIEIGRMAGRPRSRAPFALTKATSSNFTPMLKNDPVKTKLAAPRKTSGAQEKIWSSRLDEHVQPYLVNAPQLNSIRLKRDP